MQSCMLESGGWIVALTAVIVGIPLVGSEKRSGHEWWMFLGMVALAAIGVVVAS